MRHRIWPLIAAIGGTLASAGGACGQQVDAGVLLNLLVKKGLVTPAEAAEIRQEVAPPAAPVPAPPPAPKPESPGPPPGNAPPPSLVAVPAAGSSLGFRIGAADFTPLGFVDLTGVFRTTSTGNSIATGFGSIPYGNTAAGQTSETKLSAQNSRLGLRVDSTIGRTKALGYVEADFVGYDNPNVAVTSNSMTMRMRVYFADFARGPWEFLAGQDWSLLTPNRRGLSPLPGDLFYTLDMDLSYQAGLTWTRQPQLRAVYHAGDGLTFGLSAEDPDPYTGPAVTYPAGFNTAEVDTGSNGGNAIGSGAPSTLPDFIAKAAYDTQVDGRPWHFEAAGLYRQFKLNTYTGAADGSRVASGTGFSLAGSAEVLPGLTLVGTDFISSGGGRYLGGTGPDFVVLPPDASGFYSISPLRADSAILGLEWQAAPRSVLFGYGSRETFGRDYSAAPGGSLEGYGFPGSSNADNRRIDEYTLGEIQTLWKDPQHGALQVISQFSYLSRQPWSVAPGSPAEAHAGMIFLDLRYVLP